MLWLRDLQRISMATCILDPTVWTRSVVEPKEIIGSDQKTRIWIQKLLILKFADLPS